MGRKMNMTNFFLQEKQASILAQNRLKFIIGDNQTDEINVGSIVVAEGIILGNVTAIGNVFYDLRDFKGVEHRVSKQDVEKLKVDVEV